MDGKERKKHWDNIFATKAPDDVSWYQAKPEISLSFLQKLSLLLTANIIDIGGGDSFFVDNLLDIGYRNISVLDISVHAIERAKTRLGTRAGMVNWIVSDVTDFQPVAEYDLWHDRASFHFLTEEKDIRTYLELVRKAVPIGAYLVIGTFSDKGPKKCSGLDIKQYSEHSMCTCVGDCFKKIDCVTDEHRTPFGTTQNFLFCSFQHVK